MCQADELVLFERATFLVISNAVLRPHSDVHRFEKVSNIIKQFKLSCSKTAATFQTMQVRNARYSALIQGFTSTTYAMVIGSDPAVQPATILINLEASRAYYEGLIANMSLQPPPPPLPSPPPPSAAAADDLGGGFGGADGAGPAGVMATGSGFGAALWSFVSPPAPAVVAEDEVPAASLLPPAVPAPAAALCADRTLSISTSTASASPWKRSRALVGPTLRSLAGYQRWSAAAMACTSAPGRHSDVSGRTYDRTSAKSTCAVLPYPR